MRYIVTAERPTYCNGESTLFSKGDVLEVETPRPDHDGDVWACRVSDAEDGHICLADLTPEAEAGRLDERAVRAALAVKGVADADVIVRLAQAIASAL